MVHGCRDANEVGIGVQPQQKRLVDDLERRINPLFDALNCETLSAPTVEQLLILTKGAFPVML